MAAARRSLQLPSEPEPVVFPQSNLPLVSVVVPAFDGWRYTNACLKALAIAHDSNVPTEVIVVDDASEDRTPELLDACRGIRTIRLERNAGFAAACNAGARAARGAFFHFLNNDAFVTEGWERALLDAFAHDERIAAVVSQLRRPNGLLSEAGGVIWRDGQGWNYGRGNSPRDWPYRSLRDVDYGSAASLMVRADAFRSAGGFDGAYAPAYYEDVDLCFALRAAGGRIVYQPESVVYHAEGASYGSNVRPEARAAQERSRGIFVRRRYDELQNHFAPEPLEADAAARRLTGGRRIVVVDEHVPFTDRDAGSRRTFFLIELLRARGWQVIFASTDRNEYPPYAQTLRSLGVDVMLGFDSVSVAQLKRRRICPDVAWLCRPSSASGLLRAFRRTCGARIVFDTVDLHYRRLEREERVVGRATRWQAMRKRELDLAEAADVTVAGGAGERELLVAAGISAAYELPVIEPLSSGPLPGWESRDGVVFLGNFAHAPNVDAARWLCDTVMPLVRCAVPSVRLTLAGADPTRAVRALASCDVEVTGYVPDAAATLSRARVFAAPLRFGAGTKGKIVYALAHGIPVVTTPVGAEDLFSSDDYDAAFSEATAFAERIVRVYQSREEWETLVARGGAVAERFTPSAADAKLGAILSALDRLE
jgi:GT2 family glycosyltransferase/glycosyltransferase involved in cell wall biosynthesis